MSSDLIASANKLFQKKNYTGLIKLLEPNIFQFRDNFQFYYLLGLSCFYMGDMAGAESYLNRADQLKPEDIDCLLAMAVLAMKKHLIDECLAKWLFIIDLDPGNKRAGYGLALLRKGSKPDEINSDKWKIAKLMPKNKTVFSIKKTFVSAGVLIGALILAVFAGGATVYILKNYIFEKTRYEKLISSSAAENTVETSHPAVRLDLSEAEIRKSLDNAIRYFNEYRDNLVQYEANRIQMSDADIKKKETVRMMTEHLKRPDFSNFRDNFSYEDVSEQPIVYEKCYVFWMGKAANLRTNENDISFDFLVGYNNDQELLGIVPARIFFGVNINNADNIEIIGQVTNTEDGFFLNIISIHVLR